MACENERTLSTEETDYLERSTKKIKASESWVLANGEVIVDDRSFKQTLVWGKNDESSMLAMGNIEKVAFDIEKDDDTIPGISIDKVMRKEIRRPWLSALIIKLLGKTMTFTTLQNRLLRMWNPEGEIDLIDLGAGSYVAKFEASVDAIKVLTQGPWKIMDHYLTVQGWKPNFRPSTAKLGPTAVWIRLPELPIEYFNESILLEIGSKIRKPLKLDANTSMAVRGKFARIRVEVDLAKPLLSRVRVGGIIQVIEYEAMHTVCFDCGSFGHRTDRCPLKYPTMAPPLANTDVASDSSKMERAENPAENY